MTIFPFTLFNRVFYGWRIVFLVSLFLAVGSGILYHGFTIFFLPLKRDLVVSSAAISLLYGASRLEGGFEGPVVGYLIDRFGPRVMMLTGAILSGSGLILLSVVDSFIEFFFIYVFIVALGFNAGFFHPAQAAVNNWFILHRGKVFAIVGSSASVGGVIMAPILSQLILGLGWRPTAIIAGLIVLAVTVPCALKIHRSPEVLGLYPDGRPPDPPKGEGSIRGGAEDRKIEFSVREAMRTSTYWVLFSALTFRILVTVALTVHFVPLLVWKGMNEATSAYLVSLFAFGTIVISLISGWLGDRWNKALICGVGVLPAAGAVLALILGQSRIALYSLPIGLAVTMGTVPLNWALIGDFFGRRSYGMLRGIMGIGYGLGTFLSPIYAGWIFDQSGSYQIALWTFFFILLLASIFFTLLYHWSKRPFRNLA